MNALHSENSGEAPPRASLESAVPETDFVVTPAGLAPGALPTRESWERFGAELGRATSSHQWVIGDWLGLGETAFGDVYDTAFRLTGLDYGTLRDCRYVSAKFSLSRRRGNLSFAHHREVASLPPEQADALLDRAEAGSESLSLRALRELAAPKRPVRALDLRAEILKGLLRDAQSERKRLASVPGADRARTAHATYVRELEALKAPDLDDDRATDEDLRTGHYGRRV